MRRLSAATGRSSDVAVYKTCWPTRSERSSYCHTAQPRSSPRTWNTKESRISATRAKSKRSGLAARPGVACAAAVPLASRRKESQRIGLEDRPLLVLGERQSEELIDVLAEILDARARPVRAPQRAADDLREAGKVLQELHGRNAGDVEPDVGVPPQDEERFLHVQGPAAVRHDDPQIGEIDGHVVELHRIAVLGARPREDRRPRMHHHGQAALLAATVN